MNAASAAGDGDDMQGMWQYLDSTLSTPNGAPPAEAPSAQAPTAPRPPLPAAMAEGDAPPLTEDDNGMYNELGDVFNMFFNLDTDESGAAAAAANAQAVDAATRVQLSRHASNSSFGDGISPGLGAGYPSMSPATMNWLQSLGKSPSSESLSGLISPAGLSLSAGGGSTGALSVIESSSGGGSAQGGLPRSPSMEMIDWKAYNDAVGIAEKTQKDTPKWRVIPQHGPHADGATTPQPAANSSYGATRPPAGSAPGSGNVADAPRSLFTRQFHNIKSTVVSLVGALSSSDATQNPQYQQTYAQAQAQASAQQQFQPQPEPNQVPLTGVVLPNEVQQQYELAMQRMTDEKNKRKAIISPEYVQYSSQNSSTSAVGLAAAVEMPDPIKYEVLDGGHYATQVPDPTGRRPSKKSLHQAGDDASAPPLSTGTSVSLETVKEEVYPGGGPVRCKCTGKCRNARCACVKAGFVCGVHCKCVGCANPFVPMEKEGINIQKMVDDVCLMQFLSKVKDMQELLDSTVTYDCCSGSVQVKHTVENGFTCPSCSAHYTYSWCSNRLCHDQKKPRKHCAKCRRCGDHRNEHCDDCNHCYFAGVANSFSCSCKGGKNTSGGSGVKSRSVVPNVGGDDASRTNSPANGKSAGFHSSGERREDENADRQSAAAAAAGNKMTAGLSNAEAEKDDACPVQ